MMIFLNAYKCKATFLKEIFCTLYETLAEFPLGLLLPGSVSGRLVQPVQWVRLVQDSEPVCPASLADP